MQRSARPRSRRQPREETTSDSTVVYYDGHAREYFDQTVAADLSTLYDRFLVHVKPKGRILDAGCGSGRDLKAFSSRGFDATGIDASSSLVDLASQYAGVSCLTVRLQDLTFDACFDAVWACASLLHVPKREIIDVLGRLRRALVAGGVMFASVKEGHGEMLAEDGRYFAYYELREFVHAIQDAGFAAVDDAWISEDVLPDRPSIRWINTIAHR